MFSAKAVNCIDQGGAMIGKRGFSPFVTNHWRSGTIVIVAVVLYSLGFNYYIPPINGDDVVYYQGSVSLAEGNGYTLQGLWIQDWPPVQSLLVAGAMLLSGSRDYFIAKLVNLASVVVSLLLGYHLMKREQRQLPLLATLLIAISPTSLVNGTAGQADFTFVALSMTYFLMLARLATSRSWLDAVLCGTVLGAASLTRWQGVILGVGLVFQAIKLWQSSPRKVALQEVLAASIGASMVLSWKYWLLQCVQNGTAIRGNYQLRGGELWWQFAPLELGAEVLTAFTQYENVLQRVFPDAQWLVNVGSFLFWIVLLHGFYLRISSRGWRATDVYVIVTLAMYSIYAYKIARYAIPLAPFLLDYLFTSLNFLLVSAWLKRTIVAVLFAGLLAIDGVILFFGDGHSMGPRTQLLLKDQRDFLRGYHIDLYDTCRELAIEKPGATLACEKFHTLLVLHYSGLETHYPPSAPSDVKYDYFIEVEGVEFSAADPEIMKSELGGVPSLKDRLRNPRKRGQVIVWEVD